MGNITYNSTDITRCVLDITLPVIPVLLRVPCSGVEDNVQEGDQFVFNPRNIQGIGHFQKVFHCWVHCVKQGSMRLRAVDRRFICEAGEGDNLIWISAAPTLVMYGKRRKHVVKPEGGALELRVTHVHLYCHLRVPRTFFAFSHDRS